MKNGIQTTLKNIGDYGCGLLCLLRVFGYSELEIITKYREVVEAGLMTEDCFCKDWIALANFLCPVPKKWTVEKSKTLKECTFYLERWYNPRTNLFHFKLKDWDSLENSVTVKEGYIESYRLFYAA